MLEITHRGFGEDVENGKLLRRCEDPPEGKCHCGSIVVLYDCMTNECEKCGTLYNGSGTELRPMNEWEEDW